MIGLSGGEEFSVFRKKALNLIPLLRKNTTSAKPNPDKMSRKRNPHATDSMVILFLSCSPSWAADALRVFFLCTANQFN